MDAPTRVVTLGAELPEIFYALGLESVLVGVSGFTRRPAEARRLPKVGGFTNPNLDTIRELNPDLVIATSHLQHQTVGALAEHGIPVWFTNPTRLADVARVIVHIGRWFDVVADAQQLADRFLSAVLAPPVVSGLPLTIHFEEWGDPIMGPIPWVAELIEAAGARLAFPEFARAPFARDRIVTPEAVLERQPDLIVASWCGRRVDVDKILDRPGWHPWASRIITVPSDLFLEPGLNLIEARRHLDDMLSRYTT
ncbi:ABC-type transporter, periplasmic subunit [Sulfobacillus acidophilus DSM 10332]|uniref:ABC-type transporter, periplasmic subunit n=1 Tax=Sulfobacillus acidophilus (strain ATCC 700253 / DSM 10332 / NAL) TaxID=679936 RepID=G8TW63_SULAD|nr:ABC-type transporter, periplasmic subunit [Sulfobacillus acidophilus DSM 10332]